MDELLEVFELDIGELVGGGILAMLAILFLGLGAVVS
jgi:hypothetical protein